MSTLILIIISSVNAYISPAVQDQFTPLAGNAVSLHGYLEDAIQNSIAHWNRGVVPYAGFVEMFRSGRKLFAQGEMWGKAVRSGAMFYRYTRDPIETDPREDGGRPAVHEADERQH